jgi:hypothetical protein
MKSNYWLNQADNNKKLQDLDDYLMEAWSNDSNFGQILNDMPQDIKEFFLKLNITCPDPMRSGLKIGFVTEKE